MKTKVVATIGPSSFKHLKKMKDSGMNIARINTKYGNNDEWEWVISHLKKHNIEIMVDIKGLGVLDWVLSQDIDYLAVSYAKNSAQIKKIKKKLDKNVKVVSKIETIEGIKNIDGLIKNSYGLMVARGDLSENVSFEKVPYYKNMIIDKCIKQNKFTIVATEMLMSMVDFKKPTNAEVDDVFSSVIEGAKGVMLSEETAIGKYPVLSVKTMVKIVKEAEKYLKL